MYPQFRSVVRTSFSVGPSEGAHRVALRAAASLAIPLLVLYVLGRTELALYASFGAFAAVYGRNDLYGPRVFMQLSAGICIVLAMLVGTWLSFMDTPLPFRVLAIALLAFGVTLLAHRLGWKPTGPIFAVFSSGASASIDASASSFIHVIVVTGGTVLVSVVLTMILAKLRQSTVSLKYTPVFVPWRPTFLINATMILLAALASGLIALYVFEHYWYWAMIGAIAVLVGADIHARLTRGLQRFLGTLLGVVFAAGLLWIDPPVLVVFAIAILCQGLIEYLVLRNYAVAMIGITVIALAMVHLASPLSAELLLRNRLLETTIGVFVGILVTLLAQLIDFE